jgi:hypothetical protein|tara:strand:+ start:86 stop:247 length:162 start_codon:yes stop_codon:yes gene_type:complete
MIRFKGKLAKTGKSNCVIVPMDFVKHGLVKKGVNYEFVIKDVENGEKEDNDNN